MERLLAEERKAFPGWEHEVQDCLLDAWHKREEEEWQLANTIVCGSDFVRDSIGACGGPVERCVTVPYGVDTPPAITQRACHGGKLRVLMCGTVCLRKGVPYLVEAAKAMKGRIEFRIAGPSAVVAETHREIERHVALLGAVPRSQMAEHYQWADVFVLPSICEGSATVVYEALGHGLPVVTTPNAGSVVRDGVEGFVVRIRDVAAIIQSLDRLSDPQLRSEMSQRGAPEIIGVHRPALPRASLAGLDARSAFSESANGNCRTMQCGGHPFMRIAVLFDNFGPYHVARLAAASKVGDLLGIEVSGRSAEYAWNPTREAPDSNVRRCWNG